MPAFPRAARNIAFLLGMACLLFCAGLPAATFDFQQRLVPLPAGDGTEGDHFGERVAALGATLAVQAHADRDPGLHYGSESGSVYLYRRVAGAYQLDHKVVSTQTTNLPLRGIALGESGDALFVASSNFYVFVYRRTSSGTWNNVQVLSTPEVGAAIHSGYGGALAADGNLLVVGAPLAAQLTGRAYLYRRDGQGQYQLITALSADVPTADSQFGAAVAVTGQRVAVGAKGESNAGTGRGAVYIFGSAGGGASWPRLAKLLPPQPSSTNQNTGFGGSLAMTTVASASEVSLVVGAPAYIDATSPYTRGRAYRFAQVGTAWALRSTLVPPLFDFFSYRFGEAITLLQDRILVNEGSSSAAGGAVLFERDTDGSYRLVRSFISENASPEADRFGHSLALAQHEDESLVIVGAPDQLVRSNYQQGQLSVWSRVAGVWSNLVPLDSGPSAAGSEFGRPVALSGNTAAVGAPSESVGARRSQGVVHLRRRDSHGAWIDDGVLTAPDGDAFDAFGSGLALEGDRLLVAAIYDDLGPDPFAGSAYLFEKSAGQWTLQAKFRPCGSPEGSQAFGRLLALRNDVALVADSGSACLYRRVSEGWVFERRFDAASGMTAAELSLDAQSVLIGAFDGEFTIHRANAGLWFEEATIDQPAKHARVAFDGDRMVAMNLTVANPDPTTATVYRRQGTQWLPEATLEPSNGIAGDFNCRPRLFGDVIFLSACSDDVAGAQNAGSFYQFERVGNVWTERAHVLHPGPGGARAHDAFGADFATDGETLLVSAPAQDGEELFSNPDEGAVFVYVRRGDGIFGDGFEATP